MEAVAVWRGWVHGSNLHGGPFLGCLMDCFEGLVCRTHLGLIWAIVKNF